MFKVFLKKIISLTLVVSIIFSSATFATNGNGIIVVVNDDTVESSVEEENIEQEVLLKKESFSDVNENETEIAEVETEKEVDTELETEENLKEETEVAEEVEVEETTETETEEVTETEESEFATVTFVSEYGASIEPIVVKKGEKIEYDVKPEYEEYFDRTSKHFNFWHLKDSQEMWCYKEQVVTEDITLYASWFDFIVNNNVVYELNGGEFAEGFTPVVKREYGEVITLPNKKEVVKPGYKFLGWTLNGETIEAINDETEKTFTDHSGSDDANFIIVENYETKVEANWEEVTSIIVSFNTNGGSTIENKEIDYGTQLTDIIVPERKGYDFDYWYIDDKNEKFDIEDKQLEEDITLNVMWKKKSYAVELVLNGGKLEEGQNEVENVLYEEEYKIPNAVNKKGHEFIGWFTDSDYTNQIKDDIKVTENVKLYAKYKTKTYKITYKYGKLEGTKIKYQSNVPNFVYNGAESIYVFNKNKFVAERKYGVKVALPTANDLTSNSKVFAYWTDYNTGAKVSSINADYANDIVLVANWTTRKKYVKEIKASYDKNNNTAIQRLKNEGFTVKEVDLNKGCSKKNNPRMYIGVKYTYDANEAIRDIRSLNQSKKYKESSKFFRGFISYKAVKDHKGNNADFNEAAGGRYIYMFTSKKEKAGNPITDVFVNSFNSFNAGTFFYNDNPSRIVLRENNNYPTDFNHGAKGDYVYVSFTR